MSVARNTAVTRPIDVAPADDEGRRRRHALNQEVIALLDSWVEGGEEDEREQRDTLEALKRAIDEDRAPGMKLFSR